MHDLSLSRLDTSTRQSNLTNACTEIHEEHSLRHINKTGKMYMNMLDYPTTIPVTYTCFIIIKAKGSPPLGVGDLSRFWLSC